MVTKVALYVPDALIKELSVKVDEIHSKYGVSTTIQQVILADLKGLYGIRED